MSTTVTIQVTDVNDNTPQFYSCEYPACNFTDFPVSNFSGQIEEHASPRTPVTGFSIVAYDPDKVSMWGEISEFCVGVIQTVIVKKKS